MSDGIQFTELPPWDQMDFSRNCSVWGEWLSVYLTPDPNYQSLVIGPSTEAGLQLFLSALPGDESNQMALLGNMTLSEGFQKISAWYVYNIYHEWNGSVDYSTGHWETSPTFISNVITEPIEKCTLEFCQATALVGNADLTGVGIWYSYIIEALLVTLYLIAFTMWHIRRHYQARKASKGANTHAASLGDSHKQPSSLRARLAGLGLAQRTLDAFRGSLDVFLSAAMLLSLAMICSSLYLDINAITKPPPGTNFGLNIEGTSSFNFPSHSSALYDMLLSYLASCYSVFPVMLLYALKGRRSSIKMPKRGNGEQHKQVLQDTRRVWVRRAFMVIIWVLGTVQTFLSPRGNPDWNVRNDPDAISNFDVCNIRGGAPYWQATSFAEGAVILLPVLWILVTTFLTTGFGIPGVVNNRWIRRWRGVWRLGVAWVNFLIMWAVLGIFALYRSSIAATAGKTDQQNTWGFGQVLALVTWAGPVGEFLYIFTFGIEDSLDSHLPSGFEVKRVNSGLLQEEHEATGPDPFEMDQDHVVSDEKRATTSATAIDTLARRPNPTEERRLGPADGHATTIEAQRSLYAQDGKSEGQQTQTPSEHFNSTGW